MSNDASLQTIRMHALINSINKIASDASNGSEPHNRVRLHESGAADTTNRYKRGRVRTHLALREHDGSEHGADVAGGEEATVPAGDVTQAVRHALSHGHLLLHTTHRHVMLHCTLRNETTRVQKLVSFSNTLTPRGLLAIFHPSCRKLTHVVYIVEIRRPRIEETSCTGLGIGQINARPNKNDTSTEGERGEEAKVGRT